MKYIEAFSKRNKSLPFLFSYRRCPYAMRARMVLIYANIDFELIEISLKSKPAEMLDFSPKGTVPVLIVDDHIIDESMDIIEWVLNQKPNLEINTQSTQEKYMALEIIKENDTNFKKALDAYKYSIQYPEKNIDLLFKEATIFLDYLEIKLSRTSFLVNDHLTFVDIAIFPFVRQLVNVNKERFLKLNLKGVEQWLDSLIESELFKNAMIKPG
jgi:glutathione S-transferase